MDNKKNGIPKLRFPGFTGAWEQRKLGDISKTKRGLTYKPSNIDNTGIRVLRSSNIKEDTFVISDNDVFVKESAVNIPFVKNGDILITAANGSTNLVGKHAIIRDIPKNSAVHGGFMLITTSKEYEFLNASMSSNWYKKFIKKYVAGGNGAIGNLRKNDLDNQKIYVPKKDEQEKIGNFFKMLDSLITLHQRKLEHLQEQKKGLLQKMFPKNGETVPEVRFPGFTDAWEQRKLEEVAKKITKGTTPHDKSWSGPVNYVKTESIDSNNGNISVIANTSLEEHEGYLKRSQLKENDVLFSIVGTLGRVGVVKKKDLPANTNQQICIIRPFEENSFFLLNALKTNRVKSFIKSDATIGAQPSLSLWQIEGLRIPFPNLEEQQKISAFFVKLDSLIALHQRKLEHLELMKKGLLQQMFV